MIKELDSLGSTDRGGKGFGSTGTDAATITNAVSNEERKNEQMKATPISQSRQLINARQMQKLARADNPVYLAIVRKTDEVWYANDKGQKGLLPVWHNLLLPTDVRK